MHHLPVMPNALEAVLPHIQTPAYVADMAAIKRNLAVASQIKQQTGCKILLATKAFSAYGLFDRFTDALDGTTASGYYEAKLGYEHFGKDVHVYSPAFSASDIAKLAPISSHITFNSIAQWQAYKEHFAVTGLRLNPRLQLVTNNPIYNPSAPDSRFGVELTDITPEITAQLDILHVHNLCENMADASCTLLDYLSTDCAHILEQVRYVNIGGGHYITHPDYDVDRLIQAINQLQDRFNVQVVMEPGGTLVYEGGYLVASVLDIIARDHHQIAILDTSATCHMPDVLEVPYRPNLIGDAPSHPHTYILAGTTCLTGDVIGTYYVKAPLRIGDKVTFTDMMQYSFVKNTTFNGMPLPDIGVLETDGQYRVLKRFGYEAFASRLS